MEENTNMVETLFEKATDYGKTSYELLKLKALDKTTEVVSSLISQYAVLILILSFMLFLTLGLAFWLGEILGKMYYGFFVVAAFYAVAVILIHFFMHEWIKKRVSDNIIKRVLK